MTVPPPGPIMFQGATLPQSPTAQHIQLLQSRTHHRDQFLAELARLARPDVQSMTAGPSSANQQRLPTFMPTNLTAAMPGGTTTSKGTPSQAKKKRKEGTSQAPSLSGKR